MMSVSRIPRNEVEKLRSQHMTYQQIGEAYGVSRQRIWAIATGYKYKEYRTPHYKMYKRHAAGHVNPYKPCDFCQQDRQN